VVPQAGRNARGSALNPALQPISPWQRVSAKRASLSNPRVLLRRPFNDPMQGAYYPSEA
jgi:hypothetical protein